MKLLKYIFFFVLCVMISNDTIAWKPHPGPQTEFLMRLENELLGGGSRGGGKTVAGLAWMVEKKYVEHPLYRGLVIRKNYNDLVDWLARASVFYRPLRAKITEKPAIIKFPSGAYIWSGHMRDEKAYEKYVGHEYQKMLIEELTQIPRETDYEKLLSSNRSTIPGLPAQALSTTNPGGPGHSWVKARFVDVAMNKTYIVNPEDPPDVQLTRIFIPFGVEDNPTLININPSYYYWLKNLKDEKLRKWWYEGDWETFSGQFFDMWNKEIHVIEPFEIPDYWLKHRAIDWGYTAPTCVLWGAVDPDNNHYIYRELYEDGKTTRPFVEKVHNMTGNEEIMTTLADPSIWARNQEGTGRAKDQQTWKSIADRFAELSLYCERANNDRINGWTLIRDMLYWDMNCKSKLFIFNNCKNLIRTLPNLIHDEKRIEDVDTDGEDHPADALRYLLMHTVQTRPMETEKTAIARKIEEITEPVDRKTTNWGDKL